MGSWGKASLESDEGLDVLEALIKYVVDRESVKLKDLITHYRELGLLSEDPEEEDYLYDNTAIALAEIVCAYIENGKTKYEELSGLKEIVWETEELLELKQLVQQVLDNKGGERELYELREDDSDWMKHMENVIRILSKRI
ncbi:DUF4259 domain-containing protein [Aneurinibacillus migulanus]|uniref:DUF4259 domain-containing protein n=1 Tax=Aneurinibacillus migulanus TaxID=47500 RepID=A0A0D1XQZ1_ANEMI|nr:DUF4259 domain-containing protein [Aneurinibacillus migulanus]KIV56726.1 hypothetical protein TS65_11520 [Aneurinibacillus migulanus]KON97111.1 hypothetical protein AF333_18215 [Aneurinibacillus migulanus]MED0896331.1 DUF4259 domain-containing protein [Aneurinibacillus migulanus]MED1618626.1 DUF4259 domain-containing protein [Aneurinibacillus migulanus]SDK03108.1 protein of unknown function [Aneurinibacillus migulanus]